LNWHKISKEVINKFTLTPGFSPVTVGEIRKTILTVLPGGTKPLKRLIVDIAFFIRLKPGVNEINAVVARPAACLKF
jgi:hypothetical protein